MLAWDCWSYSCRSGKLTLKKFHSGVLLFLRPFICMGGFNQVRLRISGIPKEAPSGFSWVQHQAALPLQSFPSVQTHGKHSSEMKVKERGRDVWCCSRSRGLSPSSPGSLQHPVHSCGTRMPPVGLRGGRDGCNKPAICIFHQLLLLYFNRLTVPSG